MPGSGLTWALSPSTQDLVLFTYVTLSFQDESHFLKNIKTARCRAAMPLLKVSPMETWLGARAHSALRARCILLGLAFHGEQGLTSGARGCGPWT